MTRSVQPGLRATDRDLAGVGRTCVRTRRKEVGRAAQRIQVATRLTSRCRGVLIRTGPFTAALAETIADDARWAGPGARLDVVLASGSEGAGLAHVEERLGGLRRLGVAVSIVLDDVRLLGPVHGAWSAVLPAAEDESSPTAA